MDHIVHIHGTKTRNTNSTNLTSRSGIDSQKRRYSLTARITMLAGYNFHFYHSSVSKLFTMAYMLASRLQKSHLLAHASKPDCPSLLNLRSMNACRHNVVPSYHCCTCAHELQ
jgi:hypothetical protein